MKMISPLTHPASALTFLILPLLLLACQADNDSPAENPIEGLWLIDAFGEDVVRIESVGDEPLAELFFSCYGPEPGWCFSNYDIAENSFTVFRQEGDHWVSEEMNAGGIDYRIEVEAISGRKTILVAQWGKGLQTGEWYVSRQLLLTRTPK